MVTTRRIITSPDEIRSKIISNVETAIRNKFPIEAGKYRVILKNINIRRLDISQSKQRDLLLSKGNAAEGVYVDLDIIDIATNEVLHSLHNHRLVNIPYFSNRYTLLVDGNEYAIVNQMRTKSGVYTRKRGNDELESSFNLAKGANFKLIMDPETGVFKVNILGSIISMYALLKILQAPEMEIRSVLGPELSATNENVSKSQMDRTRTTLYTKLASKLSTLGDQASNEEKDQKIREYFSNTQINPETTLITLGKSFEHVNYDTILQAAKKILQVFNGKEDTDERDNLEFQNVFSVEDILKEVIDKNREAVGKISTKLKSFQPSGNKKEDSATLKAIFSPLHFSKPIRNFVTTSTISRLPSQINPMEMMDTAAIITRLGEGAISSETAVPDETRAVNYSYLGTIDPIATPESSKVGIDNRVTISALKGDDNEFYREVINTKTGKLEQHRLIDLYGKVIGLPDPIHTKDSRKPDDIVPAIHMGKLVKVPRTEMDFQTANPHDLNTITTASLPFINGNQANRLVMGAKHLQQALPLEHPESRLVQSMISDAAGDSTVKHIGDFLIPKASVDGTVSKITDEYVYITDVNGDSHKVEYDNNMPLATKTMLHNTISVKAGDTVTKGQHLGDSNFAKDGELAIGRTLSVAYMPYMGLNHEDGIVISESAAKKMTSVHAEKITVRLDKLRVLGKGKFASIFPSKFSKAQLDKLDDSGIIKPGQILQYGDPIVVLLEDISESRSNQVLGQLHKSLRTPFKDASEVYMEHKPAEVLQVAQRSSLITVMLKIKKPIGVGDKVAGSYGNKGTISKLLPDDQMPQNEAGEPLDMLLSPVGVPSRINPAQILESTLGKIATKTGKRYFIENFAHDNYIDFVRAEMKKHGVKDKETVTDPLTGKKIPNIFVGNQYIHKLFKTSDANYAARGIDGAYDQDEAPSGSGILGPKALGGMEVNALIAHNARGFMKDSSALRSSKNSEFWNAFKFGHIAHAPTEKRTFNRFVDTLKQAGIQVDRQGNDYVAGPLTDKDIKAMSSGEITSGTRLLAKDLSPERGGLFDEVITGGMQGNRWGHVTLQEPVINPVFKDAARSLLGVSGKDLDSAFIEDGGVKLHTRLNKIDVDKELETVEQELQNTKVKGAALDKTVKRFKYLSALKSRDLKPGDAYMLSMVPVTPPSMRPITVSKTGDLMENDANYLYRDLVLQNNSYKDLLKSGIADEADIRENRKDLADRVSELTGFSMPSSAQLAGKGIKGAAAFIAGDVPKHGYFQRKVVYSKMNTSGRATITPDNTIGLDEVGMPEEAAWGMYAPFVIRRLVQMGYSSYDAKTQVADRTEAARDMLLDELKVRPVVINRAPTLWRHSVIAAKPVLRQDKNLHVNSLWERATNQDYDGDATQMHVPVSDAAVKDAFAMFPSQQLFSDKKPGDLLMAPTNEPIIGLYRATQNLADGGTGKGAVKKYVNEAAAWAAYYSGALKLTDLVEIG